jgi:putative transposase
MRVIRAYRFALDPTPAQEAALRSHCGAQRFAYNWGLARVTANLGQRDAERSYGVPEELLTPAMSWSAWSLRKDFNHVKDQVAPWWAENSKEAYASGLANLAAALSNWAASRAGTRKGPRIAFPKFKGKRSVLSVRFTTGGFGLAKADRRHVQLPRIGLVRTHETTRKLARGIEAGTARIRSVTVSYRRGRWHASFSLETDRTQKTPARPGDTVGVDVGIRHLAVLSTEQMIPNPRPLDMAQCGLRRLSRQASRRIGPDRRTGQEPSVRWRKTQAKIARLHARVAHLRHNGLHQLTTRLAATYGTVVVEDLNVSGMLKNRRLARRIGDAGFGQIRRQLGYKTTWHGARLVTADRFYPSSKTCSGCGAVKAKLTLSERTYTCDQCGLVIDRDHNAARNLAALAGGASSPSRGATQNEPAGNPQKTRLAGTGYRHGKTIPVIRGMASAQAARLGLPDQGEPALNSLGKVTDSASVPPI